MPLNPPLDITDLSLTEHSEGLRLKAYPDAGGLAIGYGSHIDRLTLDSTCTPEQAQQWLKEFMADRVATLNQMLNVQPTQNIFNSLCDAAYNIVPSEFKTSTLMKYASQGNWDAAWLELPKWKFSGGKVNINLLARRRLEQAMWKGLDWKSYFAQVHNQLWWPENFDASGSTVSAAQTVPCPSCGTPLSLASK